MATMTKYHKTDSGKLAPCTATKRPCKYGPAEHTFLSTDQQAFMRDVLGVIDPDVKINPEVITANSTTTVPTTAQALARDLYGEDMPRQFTDWEIELFGGNREEWDRILAKPFNKSFSYQEFNQYDPPVNYMSDGYGDPPGYSAADDPYDDGYGRSNIYYNLRIDPSSLDPEKIAEKFYRPRNTAAHRVATAYVRAAGLDQVYAYQVQAHHGYYGEEAYLSMNPTYQLRAAAFRDHFPRP